MNGIKLKGCAAQGELSYLHSFPADTLLLYITYHLVSGRIHCFQLSIERDEFVY